MNQPMTKNVFSEPAFLPKAHYENAEDEFIALALSLGSNPFWIQGPGGNAGVKDPQRGLLFVKSSGSRMSSAGAPGFGPALCDLDFGFAFGPNKPSIELPLHLAMEKRVTAHTHDLLAQACMNLPDFETQFEQRRKIHPLLSRKSWSIVPYAMPGIDLAAHCLPASVRSSDMLFFRQHGFLASADSALETVEMHKAATSLFWEILASKSPNFCHFALDFAKIFISGGEELAAFLRSHSSSAPVCLNPDCALLLNVTEILPVADPLSLELLACVNFLHHTSQMTNGCLHPPLSNSDVIRIRQDPKEIARKMLG